MRLSGTRSRSLVFTGLVLITFAGIAAIGILNASHGPSAKGAPLPTRSASPSASPVASSSPTPAGADTVVGLGDSVMAGTNCGCGGPAPAYADLVSKSLGRPIAANNLGVGGATTTSLMGQLKTASVRAAVAKANVVLVIIGANDLLPQLNQYRSSACGWDCYYPAILDMGTRLNTVLDMIADIRGGQRGTVLVTDYWNVFHDGATERQEHGTAEVNWSRTVSRFTNQQICRTSQENGAVCVDTYAPFFSQGPDPDQYLADDGDHPNKAGVAVIARQLADATPDGSF